MRIIIVLSAVLTLGLACGGEPDDQFVPLFNGRDLSGWKVVGDPKGFEVKDGCIYTAGRGGGDLYTEAWYGNYIFRMEYMLSDVGNSGVMVRSDTADAWRTGFEVQLLAPWTPYRDDLHCTGSIYGHVAVSNRPDETTGIWHSLEIVCDRKKLTISADGTVCTMANVDSVESLMKKSLKGAIGLQSSHSDSAQWVKFRNLEIRDLDQEPDYVLMGFDHPDPRLRESAQEVSVKIGAPLVDRLCKLVAWGDPMESSLADGALFDIAAAASSPETEPGNKRAVVRELKRELMETDSAILRGRLERLLGMLGE